MEYAVWRFEIGITCEAKLGWLDCKFYDLSEKEWKTSSIQNALLKCGWLCSIEEIMPDITLCVKTNANSGLLAIATSVPTPHRQSYAMLSLRNT
jgi:hypothetical protein